MQISQEEFDHLLKNNQLIISLIGMSNIGKTSWAKKLRKADFKHICCDDLIEAKIEPELKKIGYKGLADMSKWLGQPYDDRFAGNQQRYLDLESQTMQEVLSGQQPQNTIIDTTGSVIYTGDQICQDLRAKSLVVYIKETPGMLDGMLERYLKNPKPVVWGDSFEGSGVVKSQPVKSRAPESIANSYPKLLAYRAQKYAQHADLTIPYNSLKFRFSAQEFLNHVKKHL